MSKGVPMLWQGERVRRELLPPGCTGTGRVSLLRPLRWDFFYDDSGPAHRQPRSQVARLRRLRQHIRSGTYFFFNDWDRYQRVGVLLFARYDGVRYTLVAVNVGTPTRASVLVPNPEAITSRSCMGALNLTGVPALQQVWLNIPSHYGRIWTLS